MEIEYSTAHNPTAHEPTASPQPSPKEREEEPCGSSCLIFKSVVTPISLSFGEGRGEAVGAIFALKTNALLWAGVQSNCKHTTPVANVALEYYINSKWSVEAGAMYSYWRYNSNQAFQGISGYRLEPRYRLPIINDRLEVYLGIYARIGDYDNWQTLPESSAVTGNYWDAGVSGGLYYRIIGGLGVEMGARAGHVKASVINYTREGNNNWFNSREAYRKIRVTDLNVSLVYRFR